MGIMGKMTLEVCVDSFLSLKTAVAAGADRIELCSALNLGGLTPSFGLMQQAVGFREAIRDKGCKALEVVAMIRPRSGDFCYTDEEFETMAADIGQAKAMGFDGIVTGILLPSGGLDLVRIQALATLAKPMTVVLHRAFDCAVNPERDMPALIEMGIDRLLTSGQCASALEGGAYIRDLQIAYGHLITIMPGAGVHRETIQELVAVTDCTHYHMSGKCTVASEMTYFPDWQPSIINASERSKQEASFDEIQWVCDQLLIATLSD